jgi:hypothetical protein
MFAVMYGAELQAISKEVCQKFIVIVIVVVIWAIYRTRAG